LKDNEIKQPRRNNKTTKMANTIRNILAIFGPQQVAQDFTESLVSHDHKIREDVDHDDINILDVNNYARMNDIVQSLPECNVKGQQPVALLKFYTRWSPPVEWLEKVMNDEYDRGLRLYMQSYDLSAHFDMCDDIESYHFYSTDDASNHYASCVPAAYNSR